MTTLHPPSRQEREAAAAGRPSGDATYLYCARALRDFGDGFVAVLLPVYCVDRARITVEPQRTL